MRDIEVAIGNLNGHTLSLAKGDKTLVSDKRGISPMMEYIERGVDLNGYSVADTVVGKAVAMLFVKAGIKEVYAKTLSFGGREVLTDNAVPFSYDFITEYIINRKGDGVCPMENAVRDVDNIEEGFSILKKTLESMRS